AGEARVGPHNGNVVIDHAPLVGALDGDEDAEASAGIGHRRDDLGGTGLDGGLSADEAGGHGVLSAVEDAEMALESCRGRRGYLTRCRPRALRRNSKLRAASSILPHSTEKKISRSSGSSMRTTRSQSTTPSPQAQPTGVPVTLPRSLAPCCI